MILARCGKFQKAYPTLGDYSTARTADLLLLETGVTGEVPLIGAVCPRQSAFPETPFHSHDRFGAGTNHFSATATNHTLSGYGCDIKSHRGANVHIPDKRSEPP